MTKLAVLDKDGTLTRTISGSPFPENPRDQRLIPGAEDRLKELRALGFTLSIASNQEGVGYGARNSDKLKVSYKSIDEAIEEMEFAMALTGISHAYFCPSAPESNGDLLISINAVGGQMEYSTYKIEQMIDLLGLSRCWLRGFRKPCGGMLQTIEGFATGPVDRKIMIGDRPEDEGAAKAAGFEFQWAHEWISKGVRDAWWLKR